MISEDSNTVFNSLMDLPTQVESPWIATTSLWCVTENAPNAKSTSLVESLLVNKEVVVVVVDIVVEHLVVVVVDVETVNK